MTNATFPASLSVPLKRLAAEEAYELLRLKKKHCCAEKVGVHVSRTLACTYLLHTAYTSIYDMSTNVRSRQSSFGLFNGIDRLAEVDREI